MEPTDYLEGVLNHYESAGRECIDRWKQAMREVRERNYKPKYLVSDILYFWTQASLGLWAPFIIGDPFGIPVVGVKIDAGKNEASGTRSVYAPEGDPKSSDLVLVGDATRTIPSTNVALNLKNGRRTLEVKLSGLTSLPNAPKVGNTYVGQVSIGGTTLARINAFVVPAP